MGAQPPPAAAFLSKYIGSLIRIKARQLSRTTGFCRSDEQDLAHDLTKTVLEKRHLYDPARGACPDTFFDRVVRTKVKMILRDRNRQKRAAGFRALSLDQEQSGADGSAGVLRDTVSQADRDRVSGGSGESTDPELVAAIDSALAPLSPLVVTIAKRLRHDTPNSIARDLGVSRRQVRAAVVQIRQRFEEVGLTPQNL